jgi:hypothetical protein
VPLGPALADRLGRARRAPHATADLVAVAVDGELWSIAGDRPDDLAAPPSIDSDREDAPPVRVSILEVAGNLAFSDWANHSGPYHYGRLFDSNGRRLDDYEGGGALLELTLDTAVHVSERGVVEGFDYRGVRLGRVDLTARDSVVDGMRVAQLDGGHVAILWSTSADGSSYFHLDVVAVGPSGVRFERRQFLPLCDGNPRR